MCWAVAASGQRLGSGCIHKCGSDTHAAQGCWVTCTLAFQIMCFSIKELDLIPGRPTTSVEILTQKRLPRQFSNLLIGQFQFSIKYFIKITGLKLSNGKLDGLASDLGFP